ncbi:MAG: hypothetical protein IT434_15015 [Phycisphaerales bacterium]|jgi:hypothetical protein|nr:hypothetical protein [Phycisphaerales bacterium]
MTTEQVWHLLAGIFVLVTTGVVITVRRAERRFLVAHPRTSRVLASMLMLGFVALFFTAPPAYRTVFRYFGLSVLVVLVPLAHLAKRRNTKPSHGHS